MTAFTNQSAQNAVSTVSARNVRRAQVFLSRTTKHGGSVVLKD
jgi:hypothetical protein